MILLLAIADDNDNILTSRSTWHVKELECGFVSENDLPTFSILTFWLTLVHNQTPAECEAKAEAALQHRWFRIHVFGKSHELSLYDF